MLQTLKYFCLCLSVCLPLPLCKDVSKPLLYMPGSCLLWVALMVEGKCCELQSSFRNVKRQKKKGNRRDPERSVCAHKTISCRVWANTWLFSSSWFLLLSSWAGFGIDMITHCMFMCVSAPSQGQSSLWKCTPRWWHYFTITLSPEATGCLIRTAMTFLTKGSLLSLLGLGSYAPRRDTHTHILCSWFWPRAAGCLVGNGWLLCY